MKFLFPLATLAAMSSAYHPGFSYDPFTRNGPVNWGKVDTSSENQCDGESNAPIDISYSGCDAFQDYVLNADDQCTVGDMTFPMNSYEVEAGFESCSNSMQIPFFEDTFDLLQFHVHINSEHTIQGANYPMELHMVHQSSSNDSQFAVLGLFLETGSSNPLMELAIQSWEAARDRVLQGCARSSGPALLRGNQRDHTAPIADIPFSPYDLVPEDSTYYTYNGGLTTPPCSEVVAWNVNDRPVQISRDQYDRIVSLIHGYTDPDTCEQFTIANPVDGFTNRPVVPLNGREVVRVCPV